MAHAASKRVTLDEIWPDLESGVHQLITNLNQGFPQKRWMTLYSYPFFCFWSSISPFLNLFHSNVYDYCTTSRPHTPARGAPKTVSGANFVGEELYTKLKDFLVKHMKTLLKVRVCT